MLTTKYRYSDYESNKMVNIKSGLQLSVTKNDPVRQDDKKAPFYDAMAEKKAYHRTGRKRSVRRDEPVRQRLRSIMWFPS